MSRITVLMASNHREADEVMDTSKYITYLANASQTNNQKWYRDRWFLWRLFNSRLFMADEQARADKKNIALIDNNPFTKPILQKQAIAINTDNPISFDVESESNTNAEQASRASDVLSYSLAMSDGLTFLENAFLRYITVGQELLTFAPQTKNGHFFTEFKSYAFYEYFPVGYSSRVDWEDLEGVVTVEYLTVSEVAKILDVDESEYENIFKHRVQYHELYVQQNTMFFSSESSTVFNTDTLKEYYPGAVEGANPTIIQNNLVASDIASKLNASPKRKPSWQDRAKYAFQRIPVLTYHHNSRKKEKVYQVRKLEDKFNPEEIAEKAGEDIAEINLPIWTYYSRNYFRDSSSWKAIEKDVRQDEKNGFTEVIEKEIYPYITETSYGSYAVVKVEYPIEEKMYMPAMYMWDKDIYSKGDMDLVADVGRNLSENQVLVQMTAKRRAVGSSKKIFYNDVFPDGGESTNRFDEELMGDRPYVRIERPKGMGGIENPAVAGEIQIEPIDPAVLALIEAGKQDIKDLIGMSDSVLGDPTTVPRTSTEAAGRQNFGAMRVKQSAQRFYNAVGKLGKAALAYWQQQSPATRIIVKDKQDGRSKEVGYNMKQIDPATNTMRIINELVFDLPLLRVSYNNSFFSKNAKLEALIAKLVPNIAPNDTAFRDELTTLLVQATQDAEIIAAYNRAREKREPEAKVMQLEEQLKFIMAELEQSRRQESDLRVKNSELARTFAASQKITRAQFKELLKLYQATSDIDKQKQITTEKIKLELQRIIMEASAAMASGDGVSEKLAASIETEPLATKVPIETPPTGDVPPVLVPPTGVDAATAPQDEPLKFEPPTGAEGVDENLFNAFSEPQQQQPI